MDKLILKNIRTLTSQLDGAETEFKSRGDKPEVGLTTLPTLNKMIWGFPKGMTVFAARTSIGKSSFAVQFALDFARQGIDTVFMSLEMDSDSLIERMFCNDKRVDNTMMKEGFFNLMPAMQEKWTKFREEIESLPLLLTCSIGKTFAEVNRFIEILDPKPRVVILDYVQMTKTTRNEREDLSEYVRQFRDLMLSNKMRGIVCSQINRMVEKENDYRPRLENLKGSGSLEETPDLVILSHWNWFYTKKAEEYNTYDLLIAKNRSGKTGTHRLNYYPEYFRFEETNETI